MKMKYIYRRWLFLMAGALLVANFASCNDNDENSDSLVEKIRSNISFASAISFIVFVMIYLPCLAASMVFVREAGNWKYLGYLFVFTTTTAWLMSFITYNICKLFIS